MKAKLKEVNKGAPLPESVAPFLGNPQMWRPQTYVRTQGQVQTSQAIPMPTLAAPPMVDESKLNNDMLMQYLLALDAAERAMGIVPRKIEG